MRTALFHSDVYMPSNCQEIVKWLQKNFLDYELSLHLEEHFNDFDRSHNYERDAILDTLDNINNDPVDAFEIELTEVKSNYWIVTKYVIRKKYDNYNDVSLAIRPRYNAYNNTYNMKRSKIVTAWLNSREDIHYTLDTRRYTDKSEWIKLNRGNH